MKCCIDWYLLNTKKIGPQLIEMPLDSDVLSAKLINGALVMYVQSPIERHDENRTARRFRVIHASEAYESDEVYEWIGSCPTGVMGFDVLHVVELLDGGDAQD